MLLNSITSELPSESELPLTLSVTRTLYAAVLDRAFRDLSPDTNIDQHFKRQAIAWFRGKEKYKGEPNTHISFRDCVDALELDSIRINFLMRHVNYADKSVQERKESRAGIGAFPKRQRPRFSPSQRAA